MELLDSEVIGKQKELLVDIVLGVLGAKIEYKYYIWLWPAGLSQKTTCRQMLEVGLKLYNSNI